MSKIISKSKLLATTAICAISMCANTVKAEEISILDILNNSTTKSPNISLEKVTSAGENTIQIGDEYFKYTWTNKDSTWGRYTSRQISPSENILGDFIGLVYETSANYDEYDGGSAIYNATDNTINNIVGNFVGNKSLGNYSYGSAINNKGTIGNITGNFIGNSASYNGGAIYNIGEIGDITGDFIGNSAHQGGAIYNYGDYAYYKTSTIGNITGDFIGNTSTYYGGAIHNEDSTIGNITGNFINNNTGGIYNYYGTIGNITGNLVMIIQLFIIMVQWAI